MAPRLMLDLSMCPNAGLLDDSVDRYPSIRCERKLPCSRTTEGGIQLPDPKVDEASMFRRRGEFKFCGHGYQLCDRASLHLLHHFASMGLYRDLANAKFAAYLFIQ